MRQRNRCDNVRRLVSYVDTKLVVLKQDLKDMRREEEMSFTKSWLTNKF